MSAKIAADHLARGAVVYVRQSTMTQVHGNLESQRRQYALADAARAAGFASVTVIDDDLGRSGSGLAARPGFQRLVAELCAGAVGAVFCLEASRLARNGRDWHHLVDLCALTGALVIDPDGVYDPRLMNDRLLLGLKGTMSEYELSLLRQRGLAARDGKAGRGALRFTLPPGLVWGEDGRIELDPDERVREAIRLVFAKFRELGSARQVFLWLRDAALRLPVVRRNGTVRRIEWREPAYHSVVQVLHNPLYAGAYAFGRRGERTRIVDGRAVKTTGHDKPMAEWNVLIRDHHEGYIDWARFEENQRMLLENAHMKRRAARKSGRGGRALLTGLARCGRCGRMMRVFYGMRSGHAHRYQCRGDDAHVGSGLCVGIGGVRVDRAIVERILEAVAEPAVDAALLAADQAVKAADDVRRAVGRELEEARYEASLAERRYEHVDPAKRHVARELEARWNAALERVAALEATRRAAGRRARGAAAGRSRGPAAPGPRPAAGLERRRDRRPRQAADRAPADRGGRRRPRRRGARGRAPDPLGRRAPHRGAGRATAGGRLSRGPQPQRGRGHPQARRPVAGSRARGHHEPDALQDAGRPDLDDGAGGRAARPSRRRRLRRRGRAATDDQRRRGRPPARHLRRLGAPADPGGRPAGHPADAVRAVADPGRGPRYRAGPDRPPGESPSVGRPRPWRPWTNACSACPASDPRDAQCHAIAAAAAKDEKMAASTGRARAPLAPGAPARSCPCACRCGRWPARPAPRPGTGSSPGQRAQRRRDHRRVGRARDPDAVAARQLDLDQAGGRLRRVAGSGGTRRDRDRGEARHPRRGRREPGLGPAAACAR